MKSLSNVSIEPVSEGATLSSQMAGFFDNIRKRAFELFKSRGEVEGYALDDWLTAERELFKIPEATFTETDASFELKIDVPGFSEKDLTVTAMPDALIVTGEYKSERTKNEGGFGFSETTEKSVFRRFDLPVPVNTDKVLAKLDKGLLTVTAPKTAKTARKLLPIATAA
jgi:HSP20 family protein